MVTDRNFCAMNKSKLLTNTSNEQQRLQVHSQARLMGIKVNGQLMTRATVHGGTEPTGGLHTSGEEPRGLGLCLCLTPRALSSVFGGFCSILPRWRGDPALGMLASAGTGLGSQLGSHRAGGVLGQHTGLCVQLWDPQGQQQGAPRSLGAGGGDSGSFFLKSAQELLLYLCCIQNSNWERLEEVVFRGCFFSVPFNLLWFCKLKESFPTDSISTSNE